MQVPADLESWVRGGGAGINRLCIGDSVIGVEGLRKLVYAKTVERYMPRDLEPIVFIIQYMGSS